MYTSARARAFFVFGVAFLASYAIVFEIVVGAPLDTDFRFHIGAARRLAEGGPVEAHFLFHALTVGLTAVAPWPMEVSAVVLIAIAIAAAAVVLDSLYFGSSATDATQRWDGWMRGGCTVAGCVVTAIYLPAFNERLYIGQSSPTIWHNPTSMLLKPLALVSAIFLERLLFVRADRRVFTIVAASVVVGMLAKPAFALVLIPVAGAGVLVARDRNSRIALAALAILAGLVLLVQAWYLLPSRGGVDIAPFKVWRGQTSSWVVSIALGVAFPYAVTWHDMELGKPLRGLGLAWAFTGAGAVVFALLTESGDVANHGNFSWGYQIALSILFAFALRSWLTHWRERTLGRAWWAASTLLVLHVASGFVYLYGILALHIYR